MGFTPIESVIKADIFFVITTIAVVLVTLFFLVALFYFIRIVRNFYKISKILKNYADDANSELRELGEQIRQSPLFTFLFGKEENKKGNDQPNNKKII